MYNYTVDLCILCSICIHCIVILLVCGQNSIFNGNPSGCSSWCTCPSPHFQPKPWIYDIWSFPSCFRRASENHKFMTCNPHLKSNLWPNVAKATSSSKPPIFFAAKLYILIFVSFLHTFFYYVLHEINIKIQIKIFICIFSYPVFPRPSRQVLCGHNRVHNPLSSLYRSNNKPWVSCQPGFEVHLRELRLIIMITHQHVPFKEKIQNWKITKKKSTRKKTFRILSHFKREVETKVLCI